MTNRNDAGPPGEPSIVVPAAFLKAAGCILAAGVRDD
jgi:hypothetical protein